MRVAGFVMEIIQDYRTISSQDKPQILYVRLPYRYIPVRLRFTLSVGLDPPFMLYFPRLCGRTVLRILSLRPPCAPGCRETLPRVLKRGGMLWWCFTHHHFNRTFEEDRIRKWGLHVDGRKVKQISGWGRDLRQWKRAVERMIFSAY